MQYDRCSRDNPTTLSAKCTDSFCHLCSRVTNGVALIKDDTLTIRDSLVSMHTVEHHSCD